MEITNEERREVARRIRERICRNHRAAWDVVLELSYIDVFGDRFRMNKEFTLFLADLIDRPTTTRHGKFKTKYGRETPCCEVCGYSIGDMRWNYCPKCGAEVQE